MAGALSSELIKYIYKFILKKITLYTLSKSCVYIIYCLYFTKID